jgi:hypothetical protein
MVYILAIICGTSLDIVHHDHYMIPLIPVLAVFAGYALAEALFRCRELMLPFLGNSASSVLSALIAIAFLVYMQYEPFLEICRWNIAKIYPSTQNIFYEWILDEIKAGTPICCVGAWEGNHPERFKVKDVLWGPDYFDNACGGKYQSPADLYKQGYKYFVWTDLQSPAYLADPKQYPLHCKFLQELFNHSQIVKEIQPQPLIQSGPFQSTQRGPTLRLYKFSPRKT